MSCSCHTSVPLQFILTWQHAHPPRGWDISGSAAAEIVHTYTYMYRRAARAWLTAWRTICSLRAMIVVLSLSLVFVMQMGSMILQSFATSPPHRMYRSLWEYAHIAGDLPELMSSTHGPNSTNWSNSVAICATMKDENATDVREWLLYYQCVVIATVICCLAIPSHGECRIARRCTSTSPRATLQLALTKVPS